MVLTLQQLVFNASEQPDEENLQASAFTSNFLELLRQQVQSLLKDGHPSADQVAERSGMSLRSLQRQLAKANLTYSHLVNQVRFNAAVHLLQNSNLKLIEIALELGYNDPANFTRAFKRWTGMSPSNFRRRYPKAGTIPSCFGMTMFWHDDVFPTE